jgi:hypothetical protein
MVKGEARRRIKMLKSDQKEDLNIAVEILNPKFIQDAEERTGVKRWGNIFHHPAMPIEKKKTRIRQGAEKKAVSLFLFLFFSPWWLMGAAGKGRE